MGSTEQPAVVEQRVATDGKSAGLAYVLWFFVGCLGIHNFYIGSARRGLAELAFCLGGWLLVFIGVGNSPRGDPDMVGGSILAGLALLIVLIVLWILDGVFMVRNIGRRRDQLRTRRIAALASKASTPGPR